VIAPLLATGLLLAALASAAIGQAPDPAPAATVARADAANGGTVYRVVPRSSSAACVYASADGLPGEGCAPVVAAPAAPSGPEDCVYASADGTPGEGCGTGRADDAPQP
jgi:hypothetical protein